MKTYLAVDISSSNGRIFLGTITDKGVDLKIIKSFDIKPVNLLGDLYWNVVSFYNEILETLKSLAIQGVNPVSIGIDTFGMDFCCFGTDDKLLSLPRSLIQPIPEEYTKRFANRLPNRKVYGISGMNFQDNATLYRLDALRQEGNTALSVTKTIMFIADALAYMLTGESSVNNTTACAGILTNASNGALDSSLLAHVGLSTKNFGTYTEPGMTIGLISDNVRRLTGVESIPVIAVAAYNITSSILATPTNKPNFAYIATEDISTAGMETDTTNLSENAEALGLNNQIGAFGSICLQNTISTSKLLENALDELNISIEDGILAAQTSNKTQSILDIDATDFKSPISTIKAIQRFCKKTAQPVPSQNGEIIKCIIDSFANRYFEIITSVCNLKDEKPSEIFFVGENADNNLILQSVANMTGLPIIIEDKWAAATGNIMVQAIANNEFNNIWELRELQAKSPSVRTINPSA